MERDLNLYDTTWSSDQLNNTSIDRVTYSMTTSTAIVIGWGSLPAQNTA